MQRTLKEILEVQRSDYDANFSHVEHQITCDEPPKATIRLHYVKADASGEPRCKQLARALVRYITHYCFLAERRKDLSETDRNEMFMRARDLFRVAEQTGQVGELLIYFLLETVLGAPQVLKKMLMTTNPKEERKGSDGVHLRWDESAEVLDIIFAESKLYSSFSQALSDAFKSVDGFHESRTKAHEINAFTSGFSVLSPQLQEKIVSYIEGENTSKCRHTQACLIGFDWDEYKCLRDNRRAEFIKTFDARYRNWAAGVRDSLNLKLQACKHKHLMFEFFMLPFESVEKFRNWFLIELTG